MVLKALLNFVSSLYRSARARECLTINSAAIAATVEESGGLMFDVNITPALDDGDFEICCEGCGCNELMNGN